MAQRSSGMSTGSKLAMVLVVGGIIVSMLAVKYRIFMPATTQPTTQGP